MATLPITANTLLFVVYAKPVPQGSSRAFVVKGRAVVTSANKNLKPYRQELTQAALAAMDDYGILKPFAEKHAPVSITIDFYLERPASIPKKRIRPAVKPDLDKLIRSTIDSLTGIAYQDDAQVVEVHATKVYGVPEKVVIKVSLL